MAQPNTKPYIQAATICERVLHEPDGVFSAIRMIDILTLKTALLARPPGLPPDAVAVNAVQVFSLTLLIMLKSGAVTGDHRLAIAMRDPSNNATRMGSELPAVLKDQTGVNYVLGFGLPFNAPAGQYWFDVLWDDEVLTSIPLKVQQEGVQGTTEPQAP